MSMDASSLVAEGQIFLELSIADLVFVLQRVGHFQMSIYKHLVIIRMTQERSPVGKILDMGVSYATWILAIQDVESARCQ